MAAAWTQVVFVICAAWSAGLLVSEAVLSLRGEGRPAALPALVLAAVLPLIALVCTVASMPHPERLFHLLANPASAITQQFYAALLAVVIALVWIVAFVRSEDEDAPVWAAVLAIFAGVFLVVAAARRHMLPSEPLTNGVLWVAWVVGAACVLGPATLVVMRAIARAGSLHWMRITAAMASLVGGLTSIAYGLWAHALGTASSVSALGMDFTNPTAAREVAQTALTSGEAGCLLACSITALVVPAVGAAVNCTKAGKRRGTRAALGAIVLVVELACMGGVLHAVL